MYYITLERQPLNSSKHILKFYVTHEHLKWLREVLKDMQKSQSLELILEKAGKIDAKMFYLTQAVPQSKFKGLTCAPNSDKEERRHCRCSQNNKNGKHIPFRKFLIWDCRCSYEYTLASKHAPDSLQYLLFLWPVLETVYVSNTIFLLLQTETIAWSKVLGKKKESKTQTQVVM